MVNIRLSTAIVFLCGMKRLLIIGKHWPEPQSTGAGLRMMQLLDVFKQNDFEITFASATAKSDYSANLAELNIAEKHILLNDNSFDEFVQKMQPSIVLYDRFVTEEQYGWRIAEHCPDALTILDTEDLHFLRKARQKAYKKNKNTSEAHLFTPEAKREIASILRCDLSLIISQAEMDILTKTFKVSKNQLLYLPFLFDAITTEAVAKLPTFEERKHFVMIGNYLHDPNVAAVKNVAESIWPIIHEQSPNTQLYIYGAYGMNRISSYHKPKHGVYVMGRASKSAEILSSAKVLLSPIPYGAGLKTKFLEAMLCGTPSITNALGAEGICEASEFSGFIEDDSIKQAEKAIALFSDRATWLQAQQRGFNIIETRFSRKDFETKLVETVRKVSANLKEHRQQHFIGQILQHHSLQSSKYLSKWIEEKNRKSSM